MVATGENVARDLYDAAKVLREDPTDMQADVALGESSAAVFAADSLPDLDEDQLAAVGRVTRRLLGALGADEALEDEIRHQAEVLCRLLAPPRARPSWERSSERARRAARGRGQGKEEACRPPALPGHPGRGDGRGGAFRPGRAGRGAPAPRGRRTVRHGRWRRHPAGPAPAADLPAGAVLAARLPLRWTWARAPTTSPRTGRSTRDGRGAEERRARRDEEDEDTGELVYELAEWLPEQRVELSILLEGAGIAYSWDGTDLTIAEEHEAEVDGLFEQVHGALDDDDEARYRSIEELFGAVDRLANDPGSEERRAAFLEAVGAVELPTPVGVDDAYWWRVRSQGHAVVAALDHQARNEEISREAALLAEMLHEMV